MVIYIIAVELLLRVGFSKIIAFADVFESSVFFILNTAIGIGIVLLVESYAENCR